MRKNLLLSFLMTIIFMIALIGCSKTKSYRSIKVFSFSGTCNIIRNKKELDLAKEMKLKNNDELQVKSASQAILKLDNDKFVCVKENTDVKFVATGKDNNTKTRLHVNNGGIIVEVKEKLQDKESFEIASSNSVMAIRGTQICFDVSKTIDSVTTTFSILTGKTETFLYKDDTMNSTTLIQEKMMSYTTRLNKTTDQIFKLYDSFKPAEIPTTDLKEKYNTEIVNITNDKIDEIVSVINEFEREDAKENKTISFNIINNIVYGNDPKNYITIDQDINALLDVKYLYCRTIDGEYVENDNLDVGKWYCRISASNAYESEAKEFNVIVDTIDFTIDNELEYGTNLLEAISDNIHNLNLYYRKSLNDSYALYNPNESLETGTYYIMLEGESFVSGSKTITIVKKLMTFTIDNELEYGTNLLNSITNANYPYSLYICDSVDGTYTQYSTDTSLNVGTYYVKLEGKNHYTDAKAIEIVDKIVDFDVASEFDYGNTLSSKITFNDSSVTFNESTDIKYKGESDEAFKIYDSTDLLDVGTYYVKLEGSNYSSQSKKVVINKLKKDFTLTETQVEYGLNLLDYIEADFSYSLYTSSEEDGTYTQYSTDTSLNVGTYYVKLEGKNHYTDAKTVEIYEKFITFTFTNTMELGSDVADLISDVSVDDYSIYYSTAEDGEYSLYDGNTNLSIGTYYIKLKNSDYQSQSKKLTVTRINAGDFTLNDFTYGSEIADYVVSPIESYDIYISTSIDGEYELYDIDHLYDAGTYYVMLQSATKYCNPHKLVISPFVVEFDIPNNIDYETTLYSNISRLNPSGIDYDIYISDSVDGEYSLYDSTNILPYGTYYFYLVSGTNFKSDVTTVTVTKVQATFDYVPYAIYGNNTAGVKLVASCGKFFNSSYAQEKENGNYKYYIEVAYEMFNNDFTFVFDYDHRELIINDFGDGGSVEANSIEFTYTYHLPESYEVTNNSNTQTFTMPIGIEAVSTNVAYSSDSTYYRVSARINYYCLEGQSITAKYIPGSTGYSWTTTTPSQDSDTGMWYFNVLASSVQDNTIRAYFVLVESDYETDVVTYDVSNLEGFNADTDFELNLNNESFKTLNADGTINIYKDLEFVDTNSSGLIYEIGYGKYYSSGETSISFTSEEVVRSSDRYLVLENIDNDSYAVRYIHIIKVVDENEYVLYAYENEYDFTEIDTKVLTIKSLPFYASVDDYYEGFDISLNSKNILPDGDSKTSVEIYYEDDPNEIYSYTLDANNTSEHLSFVQYETTMDITYSFIEVITLSDELADEVYGGTHTTYLKITSQELFDQLKTYMYETYGITINGTYSVERNNDYITLSYEP